MDLASSKQGYTELGASNASGTTAGVVTLVTPAANVNGCWIKTFHGIHTTAAAWHTLYSDTAAPSGPTDVTKRRLLSGLGLARETLKMIFVPAGDGVYFAANTAGGIYAMTYDLL